MKQRIVPIQIRGEFVSGTGVSVGAVGSHDDVLLEMDFGDTGVWAETTKRAIFSNALGENQVTRILTLDLLEEGQDNVYLVPVPGEAKTVAGKCFLTVEGFVIDGEKEIIRVVTEEVNFRVAPSKLYVGEEQSVTPSELEQLQAELEFIKKQGTSAERVSLDPIDGLSAENVQEAVGALKTQLDDAVIGAGLGGYQYYEEENKPISRTKGYLYGRILSDLRGVN